MLMLCARCQAVLRANVTASKRGEARSLYHHITRSIYHTGTSTLSGQLSGQALAQRGHAAGTTGRTRRINNIRAMGGVVEGVPTVSVYEAREMMGAGARYLDVRTTEEYSAGHAPGALNVPVFNAEGGRMKPNPDFVSKVEQDFPEKDQQLVLGCKVGKRSAMALQMLAEQGYTNLSNIGGGFDVWSEEGLPVEL
ncbi:hypothetical protein WJX73_005818 [Symbiochloris irregularis]|uniref:Rhodanese domain-containing protein n=1 Tax=Symbiochloris irregularis TaxID=706552 RepID=A0AAW1NXF4_9CHLO